MLRIGMRRGDFREVRGQVLRMLFSRLWVSEGNTGGANVSLSRALGSVPAQAT